MNTITVLWLVIALFTKHFICDFPLQPARQYLHKGTYGHVGGIEHALIHAIGTLIAFVAVFGVTTVGTSVALMLLPLADGTIHYHIDWAKMNINRITGWQCNTSEYFWWLMGLDQYLHALTYVWVIWMLM